MARETPQQVRRLRRYSGSRLYDPESRAYLSAGDVERLRIEGHCISIRDVETAQDVTDETLVRPRH